MDNLAYPILLHLKLKRSIVDEKQAQDFVSRGIMPLLKYGKGEEGGLSNLFVPDNTTPEYKFKREKGSFNVAVAVYAIPKHPTHLYEAGAYLAIFLLLAWMYFVKNAGRIPGLMSGTLLVTIFMARFLIENLLSTQY